MRLLPYEAVALKLLIPILTEQSRFEAHALTSCPKIFENYFYCSQKLYSRDKKSFPIQNQIIIILVNKLTLATVNNTSRHKHQKCYHRVVLFSMEILVNQKYNSIRNLLIMAFSSYNVIVMSGLFYDIYYTFLIWIQCICAGFSS